MTSFFQDHNKSRVGELVDEYFSEFYEEYEKGVRTLLVAEALKVLMDNFRGDMKQFEEVFVKPAAEIMLDMKQLCGYGQVSGCFEKTIFLKPTLFQNVKLDLFP